MAKCDSVYWAFTKSITSMLPRTNHESEMTSAKWVTARKPQIYCGAGERLNQISEVTAVVMTSAWQHRRNHTDQVCQVIKCVLWYTFGCQNKKKIKGNLSSGVFFFRYYIFLMNFGFRLNETVNSADSYISAWHFHHWAHQLNLGHCALPWKPNACFSS